MDSLYVWVIKHRNPIVSSLVAVNCLLAVVWYLAFQSIILGRGNPSFFFRGGTAFGQIALVCYVLTVLPGIARRFGKFYKPVSILMIFRRYIGIMTFMFVLIHASIVRFFWILKGQMSVIPTEVFQVFGFLSFIILFSLFITSNDWSVRKLGRWWEWIHNLTYIVVWFIFAHVALQRVSVWSILAGIASLAQIASHIYARRKVAK